MVYLRVGGEDASVSFVAAKTRVAPVNTTTIPRLELLSALLLAKLCSSIENALEGWIKLEKTACLTDSKVALCWIRGQDQEWKTFVENRVTSIRKIVPAAQWSHCPGRLNPADIPSRGMMPRGLQENETWTKGPEWLKKSTKPPVTEKEQDIPEECLVERRKKSHTLATLPGDRKSLSQLLPPEKFSSWKRLMRTTSLVLKFVDIVRGRREDHVHYLHESRKRWLLETQVELTQDSNFSSWKRQLNLQQDGEGLWRCVGRLHTAPLNLGARDPILIERSHHVSRLLVEEAHKRVLHDGPKETLTELRAEYRMLKARPLVKKLIRACLICRRYEGRPFKPQEPPPLPAFRVQPSRPFASVGVDFAGPLYIREEEDPKTWLCLYTCAATRAVHLDLVRDLNTSTFLRSFRRLCARRGTPEKVVSDNAGTFKSADATLQTLLKEPEIQDHFHGMRIQWHFNTEKAPWQGGMFERMIKSAKRCLRKSIGKKSLTFDELLT